ncbi:hypothetical protein DWW02_29930 [Enterocloster bolteae]|uniref:Uncharacterized protein n=1 Tax=Enterocloster bolteae TaxID=208479 RepID=A0A412YRK7_9FIRM|nr:hypothetical protein DWW02_29930 [Enterocloster bolteae]
MYHGITVEHSYNCMVLLCRLFLGLSRRYTNLSGKAGYGDNTFRGKQHVITYAGIGDRAYLNMQFVSEAPWSENNATRAGYGFHNAGANGGAIYLDIDGRLKFIASDTKTVYALDWHIL